MATHKLTPIGPTAKEALINALPYHVGDTVEVTQGGWWTKGEVTDVFFGPFTNLPVFVVGDSGYYLAEIREAV